MAARMTFSLTLHRLNSIRSLPPLAARPTEPRRDQWPRPVLLNKNIKVTPVEPLRGHPVDEPVGC